MADQAPAPATAESGFIFKMPAPENPFTSDTYFQRALAGMYYTKQTQV